MARFIRDEKRTYPLWWLAIGGVFAGSAAWAVYAELVTRVPWQKQQQAFFEMELQQATEGKARADKEWKEVLEPKLKARLDRKAALEQSQKTGEYATARARLDQLNKDFSDAEMGKTFGSSDLDEAYYHRQEAEYERDAAASEVREYYHDAYAAEDPKKGDQLVDAIYADPPLPAKKPDQTDKMFHLVAEIERGEAHVKAIESAMAKAPNPTAAKALQASKKAEQEVIEKIKVEVKNQERVDTALAAMGKIDGPGEPTLSEKDPIKRAAEKTKLRNDACKGKEDTRNCILWQKLEPVDNELKSIDVEVSKQRRTLVDAELREQKAQNRAHPKFDIGDVIHSIVGPYQIQQTVHTWIDFDRDVDREQVDRCSTCHMGEDSGSYTSAAIPRQFRTHPFRSTLFNSHPVEKFGCTSCHQGQGRSTDKLSHSGWQLEEEHGRERWHYEGDEFWEDPLLPVGALHKIIVDEHNDELSVKVGRGKWIKVSIEHRSPEEHDKDDKVPAAYVGSEEEKLSDEQVFFGEIQKSIQKAIEGESAVKGKWHAIVRKLDNRIQIGVEQDDPTAKVDPKDVPSFGVKFDKPGLGEVLGFGVHGTGEFYSKLAIQTGTQPPSVPVRSDGMASHGDKKDGFRYHPPRGSEGVQIPDDMRNRFIQSLPEVESGCVKCHTADVDLKPRASKAKFNFSKLDYERAEAWKKKDPEGYKKAHDGSDELPTVTPDPAESMDPAPTYQEGRQLFKKLNCTGCHILDGFPWDKNSGPGLDNVSAKVSPEWLLGWIRYPRGWRAKTRMPNLWPKPLDPASKRPLPKEAPEYAKWEATMREETVAIASFLYERSDNPASRTGASPNAKALKGEIKGYADVAGATAEKGKVLFESYGCQGCHARSDGDSPDEVLPEPWRSRERDIAPTLANMAGKTTADWIAYWVEEPNRYWHGTKMPNLRLSREEAASVGKYVASLSSKPLAPADVEKGDAALVSDPAKRNEKVPCANAGGALMTRVECGEKLIGYYGCFGCHNISGFEKSAPIAPELGGFAKKDIATLDFGYAIPDHHLQTTETFATLKLDAPRIYRRDRIELKMGDFDLSPREIRAIVVFLKGLVNAKPRGSYAPAQHADYNAALEGRQIVEDYNCRACHVIEDHGGDINGFRQNQLAADTQARAPHLNGEGARVQPEWLFNFLRAPGQHGIRPWLHPEWAYGEGAVPDDKKTLRMPTFNFSEEQVTAIVRYFASWDGQEYPYQAAHVGELDEPQKLYTLTHMLSTDAANCLSCHYQGAFPKDRGLSELAKMAPNLNNVARRLRPDWVKAWLLRPQNWLEYTKMTAFWATKDRPKDGLFAGEQDPFISDVPAWTKVPGPDGVTAEMQAEMVRDFLFSLPADAVFPKSGEEKSSPLVHKPTAEEAKAEADKNVDDKGKDKDDKSKDKKDKSKEKKTGSAGAPMHG